MKEKNHKPKKIITVWIPAEKKADFRNDLDFNIDLLLDPFSYCTNLT